MPTLTTVVGALLTLLGLGGYVGSGRASKTALIPAGFGAALVALGLAGRAEGLRPHAMHGAAAVALLGVLGSARGAPAALRLARGEQVARPAAAAAQAAMFVLCVGYMGASVRSFIAARRARRREA
jgi:hypothetical protein